MGFGQSPMITHRVVVGISDMSVTTSSNVILSTYALGSCVAVLAYDAASMTAGLIHIMLPSIGNRRSGEHSPYMFVDTGLPLLIKEMIGCRARKERLTLALIGGASVNTAAGTKRFFKIGEENILAARSFFKREGMPIHHEDTGGFVNRTVHFELGKGLMQIKKPSGVAEIQLR